jgi:hypothetical protein
MGTRQRVFFSVYTQLGTKPDAEVGADISKHASKTLQRYLPQPRDSVITVGNEADANCPTFPGG